MASELMLHVGIGIMGIAAFAGIVTVVFHSVLRKRLSSQLDREYGKKRH